MVTVHTLPLAGHTLHASWFVIVRANATFTIELPPKNCVRRQFWSLKI